MKNFPFPTVPIIAKFPHITVPIIAEFPPSNCSQSLLNFCAVCRGMPWPGKKLILQQMMDVHSLCKLYHHQNIQLPKSKQQQQGLWTVSKLCTVYEQQHAPRNLHSLETNARALCTVSNLTPSVQYFVL